MRGGRKGNADEVGNFVSNYHWQDGIGPIADRPKTIELAWLSDDPNIFGTDEYVEYCQGLGAEPYICLNSTSCFGLTLD